MATPVHTIVVDSPDPQKHAAQMRDALTASPVVHLVVDTGVADLRSHYDTVVESIGEPLDIAEDFAASGAQTGDRWMEIRYDEDIDDMVAFRYGKNAQPLHTDESYISEPADVMLFYGVAMAPSGGETVFVDGRELITRMETEAPALLEQLVTTPVTYRKADNHRRRPIIQVLDDGEVSLNFNYYCLDERAPQHERDLNQAFHNYLQTSVLGSDLVHSVQLEPGNAVAWWDHRVLHGRNAFEANGTNSRFIWKAGLIFPPTKE